MKKTYLSKGFTLIELLVVIAIIGILSSIVLASLSTARSKGKTSAIKAAMTSLRSEMELYANGGSYGSGAVGAGTAGCQLAGSNFVVDTTAAAIVTNIRGNVTTPASDIYCSTDLAANATKWAAAVTLPDSTGSFCVDSSGAAVTTAAGVAATRTNAGVCI